MADASFLQTSFLGGEWSKYAQGRAEDQGYRMAMNLSSNGFPLEEGAWTRRPGTRTICNTRRGQAGILREFHFTQTAPYTMVLTNSHLRFTNGPNAVLDGLPNTAISISSANPAVVATSGAHGWTTGDDVIFTNAAGDHFLEGAVLFNRQFTITVTDATHFSIADAVTQVGFDGSTLALAGTQLQVARVLDYITPYSSFQWQDVNTVQNEQMLLLLHPKFAPRQLTAVTDDDGTVSSFALTTAVFSDGPYLDPPTDGSTVTPSGVTGTINVTATDAIFAATDVGRQLRLLSEPHLWDAATPYAIGDIVSFNLTYWQALATSTGTQPDLDVTKWVVNPEAGAWTWGVIQSVLDANRATLLIKGTDLLYTLPVRTYRLGLYSDTTGYPSCGCYHEGRIWLSGAQKNRFDASASTDPLKQPLLFTPTGPDGTVADDNGISEEIAATDINSIFWMLPEEAGIVMGTKGGEWLIQASQLADPLTPTSIQAHRVTRFGATDLPPVQMPLAAAFVQRYNHKIIEYLSDSYTGKYSGQHLSAKARHLMSNGVNALAYMQEPVPVLWAMLPNGTLAACTYKRDSKFSGQPPTFSAWSRQSLGSGRKVISIATGPSLDGGATDTLTMITWDTTANVHWVELLTPVFEEGDDLDDANFTDSSVQPAGAEIVTVGPNNFVNLYGLHSLEGQTVTVWGAGFDLGDFVVTAGAIQVPIDQAGSLFTQAWLDTLTNNGKPYLGLGVVVNKLGAELIPVPNGASVGGFVNPGSGVTAMDTDLFVPDWANDRGFTVSTGASLDTNGFNKFTLSTQAWADGASVRDLMGSAGAGTNFCTAPAIIGSDGNFYWNSNGLGCVRRMNPDTMTLTGTFGGSLVSNNSSSAGIAPPLSLAPLFGADKVNYLLSSREFINSLPGELTLIDVDTMSWIGFVQYPGESEHITCKGAPGEAWALGRWEHDFDLVAGSAMLPLALRKVTVDATSTPALVSIASIVPHNIDAQWTHFTQVQGLGFDETDGNLLTFMRVEASVSLGWSNITTYGAAATVLGSNNHIYLSLAAGNLNHNPTTDAGVHWQDQGAATYTHPQYLVKLSKVDGSVVWKLDLGWFPQNNIDYELCQSRIRFGTLGLLSSVSDGSSSGLVHYPYQLVNTIAGTFSAIEMFQCSTWTTQTYDSQTGALIANIVYTYAPGFIPAPVTGGPSVIAPNWAIFPVVATPGYYAPFTVGITYASEGQVLRPIAPPETGAQNGPALGKTRRSHQFAVLMHGTRGISFGTDPDVVHPVEFQSPSGRAYNAKQNFSGVHWGTLDDDYGFDSMLYWTTTRPYPTTLMSVECFLHTQDR